MMQYSGACHCGSIKFTIDWQIDELTTCDCSLCTMRNAVMARVPEHALSIKQGEDVLRCYQWNTRIAMHYFCGRCGIYVFHRKRAMPEHFGVNVNCLVGFDAKSVPIRSTEGANMTVVDSCASPEWPGPRFVSE